MPFLSKHFTFDYDFSSATPVYCTSRRDRTKEEQSDIRGFYHRPTLSAMFYNNLKETLQHTTLENITYYDDDLSIKIFGINLKFACAQNSNSTSIYHCTPIAIEQFIKSDGLLHSDGYIYSNNKMEYKTITSTTDNNIRTISYGIKVYYNNNFIICNCESYLRFEIPIFCIIQGNANNSSKKVTYLGQCPNVVGTADMGFYHRLVIPDESSEYDSVFPATDNKNLYDQTRFDGYQVHYIFDADVYPNRLILNTLYDTDTQFQSVYMKKLTSWNGLVQYNNVYDVSAKIESSRDENISKITTNSVYTINGNQYYCPGTSVTTNINWGVHDYRRPLYLFKL